MKHWKEWLLIIEKCVAPKSTCFSRHIGALIIAPDEETILSAGWNSPIVSCNQRLKDDQLLRDYLGIISNNIDITEAMNQCPRKLHKAPSGTDLLYCHSIHAEVHAITGAAVLGNSTVGSTMFLNCGIPCKNCLVAISAACISQVIVADFRFYDRASWYILKHMQVEVYNYEGEKYVP